MIAQAEARRIALAALGFGRGRPARPDARHIRDAIRRLSLVQIDSVNVLVQAHYLVLFSRLGAYDRGRFNRLVYAEREFIEQWAHEASIVPAELWPLLEYRRAEFRIRPFMQAGILDERPEYADWVIEQIRERGALAAADLAEPEGVARRIPGSWYGSIPRIVLEALFARGVLCIADRLTNFARSYDLAERVVGTAHRDLRLSREEAQRELIRIAARAYGIATAADLGDYFRMLPRDAKPRIAELAEAGELELVEVEGWRDAAYLHPAAARPRKVEGASLLSPFDPVVWFRRRAERLFDFEYRIEIYTPAERRTHGYYVLPFLLDDRIVARVDLKADRKQKRLRVLSAHYEPGVKRTVVRGPLRDELKRLAGWLELETTDGV
ncbi:MAG: YcaQ family DNA glycosylase [Acidobacteria bacterium]|nr:YcaQ family DNA glycosylase [Acidobacteriota bacterium]